ncbi:MAG: hypothetical protein M1292_00775 [Bacteroidetes bacterium]|nr:hypothetical protein [Bacteroidota bacterium]
MDAETILIILLSIFAIWFTGHQILTFQLRKLKKGQLENLQKLCEMQQKRIEEQEKTIKNFIKPE